MLVSLKRLTILERIYRACVQCHKERQYVVSRLAHTKKDEPTLLAFFTGYIICDVIRTIRTTYQSICVISSLSSHMTDNHRLSCSLVSSQVLADISI